MGFIRWVSYAFIVCFLWFEGTNVDYGALSNGLLCLDCGLRESFIERKEKIKA